MPTPKYTIEPAIGIARLGDSPDAFYLAPERTGDLPIQCDDRGNGIVDPTTGKEKHTSKFKDGLGRVKRQAARFGVYVHDEQTGKPRRLKIGDHIQGTVGSGPLVDIRWTVHLANKKAVWFEFRQLEGEHGYAPDHPRRNLQVPLDDSDARQALIIDPGPQTVSSVDEPRSRSFSRGGNPGRAQSFPPSLRPCSIDTLGSIMTDDEHRLVVLGGHGNSGSYLDGFGDPKIKTYANNDGWFDDTSDGPVMALLHYYDTKDHEVRVTEVAQPAWVIVGYPSYAPQIVDLVTLDDLLYDLNVQQFATRTDLYGVQFDPPEPVDPRDRAALSLWRNRDKHYNPDYYPDFNTEIYPIITRPYNYQFVSNFLAISNVAHEVGYRGDFDLTKVSIPPKPAGVPRPPGAGTDETTDPTDIKDPSTPRDPYRYMRQFIYQSLRGRGQENLLTNLEVSPDDPIYGKELMPLLCGDNPISNTLPSKFFRLTDTQLFLLRQWAEGKFRNETPWDPCDVIGAPDPQQFIEDQPLTQGVIGNILGGSFCPGGEVGWIMRNPAIYSEPFRIKADPAFVPTAGSGRLSGIAEFIPPPLSQSDDLRVGLQPGDVTKHMAVPWQSDFNECYTQDVDVTFELWNELYYPDSTNDPTARANEVNITMWWPSHRPMQVFTASGDQVEWAGTISQDNGGDLLMVTAWKDLGFVLRTSASYPQFTEVEANEGIDQMNRTPYRIPSPDRAKPRTGD